MDIQQPQSNINQPAEPNQPLKKKWLKFGLSIAVVIICLVATGVAVYWIMTEPTEENVTSVNVAKTDNTGLVPSGVEGWQTYRNEELGFEVKYPKNWEFSEGTNRVYFKEINKSYFIEGDEMDYAIALSFWPGDKDKLAADLEHRKNLYDGTIININIDSEEAFQITDYLETGTLFIHRGREFDLSVPYFGTSDDDSLREIYSKILSTFKFIK
ncbi:MAG: hypothetical protein CO001_00945 [Candidatus Portnoybacteria bacterium CG_4_8_14_3_um_filter_40_10]|uniref:PsbP C-terminal domain-containing protein n=4 Tax=Candidatus Portnoyibacteriota TaxID=1817913 RepID=A0A2M7IJ15_9BACT|nr:MAG: hypothetical protein COV84_00550 [Candidatus Portnoybacteria bacterium CG11_big_fil_rev_8_21_14_0_20_40_15]PIS29965.1 MAG: hypothetical protein COT41_03910 [Candidatus Portnoybacteria bacterium CG08_land_8_20_14_0_20_40_83]PIW76523.1 MAG: hypothetical protein CO001_00945 [Candidatus Portnoybacteria bacterium CG_4_8_14_3_um_filter_40_10]PIY74275.1 MAG: hypothetical protein COY85_03740 [Candidatus Portnoybacteria bacterium CG_4_10_14_0_8_um_filter_40_50]PJA64720.1 MAG: hypothetical protei